MRYSPHRAVRRHHIASLLVQGRLHARCLLKISPQPLVEQPQEKVQNLFSSAAGAKSPPKIATLERGSELAERVLKRGQNFRDALEKSAENSSANSGFLRGVIAQDAGQYTRHSVTRLAENSISAASCKAVGSRCRWHAMQGFCTCFSYSKLTWVSRCFRCWCCGGPDR